MKPCETYMSLAIAIPGNCFLLMVGFPMDINMKEYKSMSGSIGGLRGFKITKRMRMSDNSFMIRVPKQCSHEAKIQQKTLYHNGRKIISVAFESFAQ